MLTMEKLKAYLPNGFVPHDYSGEDLFNSEEEEQGYLNQLMWDVPVEGEDPMECFMNIFNDLGFDAQDEDLVRGLVHRAYCCWVEVV